MGRKYNTNPIIEALCEFQFASDSPWNDTIPGLFLKEVESEFPNVKPANTLTLSLNPSDTTQPARLAKASRTQFWNEQASRCLQVGMNLLVVNQLKPYDSWPNFRPLIERALGAYIKSAEPTAFQKIELRYINRIEFDCEVIKIKDYFQFYPEWHHLFVEGAFSFMSAVRAFAHQERDIIEMSIASQPSETDGRSQIILTLGYSLVNPTQVAMTDVNSWLEVAHEEIEKGFETAITEKLSKLFDNPTSPLVN